MVEASNTPPKGAGLDALHGMGFSADAALQLHKEVLAYSLGLLVLQASGSPQRKALETCFMQAMQRWLDHACCEPLGPAQECQCGLFSLEAVRLCHNGPWRAPSGAACVLT